MQIRRMMKKKKRGFEGFSWYLHSIHRMKQKMLITFQLKKIFPFIIVILDYSLLKYPFNGTVNSPYVRISLFDAEGNVDSLPIILREWFLTVQKVFNKHWNFIGNLRGNLSSEFIVCYHPVINTLCLVYSLPRRSTFSANPSPSAEEGGKRVCAPLRKIRGWYWTVTILSFSLLLRSIINDLHVPIHDFCNIHMYMYIRVFF